jgi:hypothetical protein
MVSENTMSDIVARQAAEILRLDAEIERLRSELFRMHSQRLAAELAEIRAREADRGRG